MLIFPPGDLTPEEFLEQDDLDDTAPSALTLHLDLDYIVRRVEPPAPLRSVEFWVSPAMLVFHSVWPITGDLRSIRLPLQTRNLYRLGPVTPHDETAWHLAGRDFELRFRAWSFTLYLRHTSARSFRQNGICTSPTLLSPARGHQPRQDARTDLSDPGGGVRSRGETPAGAPDTAGPGIHLY